MVEAKKKKKTTLRKPPRNHNKRRLSSIDLLPDKARAAVDAALSAFRAGNKTKEAIRRDFNSSLKKLGLGTISSTAFSRWSLRHQAAMQRHAQALEIARAFADKAKELDQANVGAVVSGFLRDILLAITLKLASEGENIEITDLKEAALALYRLNKAEEVSLKSEREVMREAQHEILAKAREEGLNKNAVNRLKLALGLKND